MKAAANAIEKLPNGSDALYTSFLQDRATFYLLNAPDVSHSPLENPAGHFAASDVLDGARGEKVLSVACPHENVVLVGTTKGFFQLTPTTGDLIHIADDYARTLSGSQAAGEPDASLDAPARPPVPRSGAWAAEEGGLLLYTQDKRLFLTGQDGLPLHSVRCAAQATDGALWVGGEHGAARLHRGAWRCFAGRRWLPGDNVNGIALDAQGRAWIATDKGVACIASSPMTWAEKAAHYEAVTQSRHNRDGYVTECLLTRPGDLDSFVYEASDNDGLWTSLYLCAECFRYAVTGEQDALTLARKSLRALLDLARFSGVPGFPVRALVRPGERAQKSEPPANWSASPLDSDVLVKGDTSSDEIAGHYFAWFVVHALAADASEKEEIAQTCRLVTDHILDNNYTLAGQSGKRTSWGVWSPDVLNNDPDWMAERGLGSLEILSHLRVANHLYPCPRYEHAYRDLIEQHGYALNTIRQKMLPPLAENNHSDDELAAISYYPLLLLETDPHLRAIYLLSLERTQQILRPQRSPFHNVIYQACSGRACDADSVRAWLQDAPLDLRDWAMTNSRRADVVFAPDKDRFGKPQLVHPLPPSEIGVMKWNRNPYLADWEGEGRREMDGAFWLLPYWMGRYHQVLAA